MELFGKIAQAGVISDATKLSTVGLNILDLLLSVFGIIGIIGLVGSGIMYLTSSGNENQITRAKKWSLYSIVGIIIALSAIVLVRQLAEIFE